MNTIILIFLGLVIFIIGIFLGRLIKNLEWQLKLPKIRKAAIKQSKAVKGGQIYEQFVPFSKDFLYDPKDCFFLGKPIDYIVFDGLHLGKLKEIIFLEIKTGKSQLNNNEKQVKEIIERKKIKWNDFRS
jgi:predicted Holliday junction resolvase-like endonuclease